MIRTFQQHIAQQQLSPEAADLPWILSGITLATKMIEARIRRAGFTDDALGAAGATNVQGEAQQKLDVYANEAMLHCLGVRNNVVALISEEMTLVTYSSSGTSLMTVKPDSRLMMRTAPRKTWRSLRSQWKPIPIVMSSSAKELEAS